MHPCADVSWIDNVYQNLQKFLALEETQTKDEDRQPQSTLSRAPILLQSSSLANASLSIQSPSPVQGVESFSPTLSSSDTQQNFSAFTLDCSLFITCSSAKVNAVTISSAGFKENCHSHDKSIGGIGIMCSQPLCIIHRSGKL